MRPKGGYSVGMSGANGDAGEPAADTDVERVTRRGSLACNALACAARSCRMNRNMGRERKCK